VDRHDVESHDRLALDDSVALAVAAVETLHFVGLALLVGTVGMLDLRLLGRLRHLSFATVHSLVRGASPASRSTW
jgi:hypothetical protein